MQTNEKISPKELRNILQADNDIIIDLCRKASLVPKRDEHGQTFFTKNDVDVLKNLRNLNTIAQKIEKKAIQIQNPIDYQHKLMTKSSKMLIDNVNNNLANFEKNLSDKISQILDEKLDGMDEVVVELIRVKTENETLRYKLNEQDKEIYKLKSELLSYLPVAFGLYLKK